MTTQTARPAIARVTATPRETAVALARSELPRLLRHPGTLLGVAFAVLLITTAGPWGNEPGDPVIDHLTWGLGLMMVPLAVTFALLGGRSARDDTSELEMSTAGGTRTPHLAALALTVLSGLGVVLIGVTSGVIAEIVGVNKASMFAGPFAAESLLVLGQAAVAATAACCFALAAGSWLPYRITAGVMVVVVLQGADTTFHPNAWDTSASVGPLAWHLVYGLGITVLAATVALARHRRDAVTALVGSIGAVLALAGGIWQ